MRPGLLNKEIWEGWTVQDFIDSLSVQLEEIMSGRSWCLPFTKKADLRRWCADNQPYYKKPISEVVNFFAAKYGIVK